MKRLTKVDDDFEGNTSSGAKERELEELFAQYVEQLNRGEKLHPQQILARHPELGEELLEYLEDFVAPDPESDITQPLGTIGDYKLLRRAGRGGMGVVYEAWENSIDRRVALQVLPAGIAADTRAFMRFMREAKAAGRLSHPNVVPVYAMGVKEDTPYYVMLTGQSPRTFPRS